MSSPLLHVLADLLPDASFNVASERPWFSLTFSGLHLSIEVVLSGKDRLMIAKKFTRELSTHNFALPSWLVADIAVTEQIDEECRTHLTIDALLLDD